MVSTVNSVAENERTELTGRTLEGLYQVGARVGGGGTGIVFEGLCLKTHKPVALKTLRPHLIQHIDLGTRLRRELEVSRRVVHPSVVRFIGDGTLEDGSPYLAMPLLRGVSLGRLLLRYGELPAPIVLLLASRLASVLHSAHMAGYVHRDVKPEHVMLSETERHELRVHLLDFGVCWSATAADDERRRESGRVFGTPSYVSPEQAAGEVKIDGRADLFGLGVVMFEALSGSVPFSAATVTKLLLRIIREEAPRVRELVEVDARVDALIAQLLARDPAQRMPSARALSRALLPFAAARAGAERQLIAMMRDTYAADPGSVTLERAAPTAQRVRVA